MKTYYFLNLFRKKIRIQVVMFCERIKFRWLSLKNIVYHDSKWFILEQEKYVLCFLWTQHPDKYPYAVIWVTNLKRLCFGEDQNLSINKHKKEWVLRPLWWIFRYLNSTTNRLQIPKTTFSNRVHPLTVFLVSWVKT